MYFKIHLLFIFLLLTSINTLYAGTISDCARYCRSFCTSSDSYVSKHRTTSTPYWPECYTRCMSSCINYQKEVVEPSIKRYNQKGRDLYHNYEVEEEHE